MRLAVAEFRYEFSCREVAIQHLYKDFEITPNYLSYRNQQQLIFLDVYNLSIKTQEIMDKEILQIGGISIHPHEIPSLLQRYQVIPQIQRGIVIDQAISNISLTESEADTAIDEFKKRCRIISDNDLRIWLQIEFRLRKKGRSTAMIVVIPIVHPLGLLGMM